MNGKVIILKSLLPIPLPFIPLPQTLRDFQSEAIAQKKFSYPARGAAAEPNPAKPSCGQKPEIKGKGMNGKGMMGGLCWEVIPLPFIPLPQTLLDSHV